MIKVILLLLLLSSSSLLLLLCYFSIISDELDAVLILSLTLPRVKYKRNAFE